MKMRELLETATLFWIKIQACGGIAVGADIGGLKMLKRVSKCLAFKRELLDFL